MTEQSAPPRGCPDASILAAYVEGKLDAASRREVERHVADCPECPIVIADTGRFLQSDAEEAEADDPPATRPRWWLAAAAFAALCIAGVVWQGVTRDPLVRVKKIVAKSRVRLVEGRLTGFEYAPYSALRSGTVSQPNAELRAEAERLQEGSASDAGALHARGVALLLAGEVTPAIQSLETATRRTPSDAAIWTDLAVAYLSAGTAADDREQLTRALHASERASSLLPSSAAAQFNRAIALERLDRRADAEAAYRRALALEEQSGWRQEMTDRLARMSP